MPMSYQAGRNLLSLWEVH